MIANAKKAPIYETIDKVIAETNQAGLVCKAANPFLFRGVMHPPGTYKIALRFDKEREHLFLRLDRKP